MKTKRIKQKIQRSDLEVGRGDSLLKQINEANEGLVQEERALLEGVRRLQRRRLDVDDGGKEGRKPLN
jgi:hypothetical protein